MVRYPDTIAITTAASGSMNASGMWTAGASGYYSLNCRAEVNGSGKKVATDDGSLIDYSFDVYLPAMTTVIPTGSGFSLSTAYNGTITGKVKRASNGQLNSRLWL